MTPELIHLEPFCITGLAVRTSNKDGRAASDIATLWSRLFAENIAGKITNKVSDDLYCLYTDYESDHSGAYTTILGYKVSRPSHQLENLVVKDIPGGNYKVYISSGKLPECIAATWNHIWATATPSGASPSKGEGLNRLYTADFDVYGPKAKDPNHAEVQTFVAVR